MTKFTQTYPTDLKYTEWQQIEQYLDLRKKAKNIVFTRHIYAIVAE